MKKRKILRMIISVVLIFSLCQSAFAEGSYDEILEQWIQGREGEIKKLDYDNLNEVEKKIWEYYDTVNQRDKAHPDGNWEKRVELTDTALRSVREGFSSNQENRKNKKGIFNVESLQIVFLKEVETATDILEQYPGSNLTTYLIGYNACLYNKNDVFYFDGINFDEVILRKEGEDWYILENCTVPTELLEKEVGNKALIEEAVQFNTEVYNAVNYSSDAGINTYVYEPDSNVEPTAINIYIKSKKTITTDYFGQYIKKSLALEAGTDYDGVKTKVNGLSKEEYLEGMKACAMAVKMYGWFCVVIFSKHKQEGAHVCDETHCQKYENKTPAAHIDEVCQSSDVNNMMVRTDSGGILYAQYSSGDWSTEGTAATGELSQRGAFYLAAQGKTYQQILSYYYANVPKSTPAEFPSYPNTTSRGPLQFLQTQKILYK